MELEGQRELAKELAGLETEEEREAAYKVWAAKQPKPLMLDEAPFAKWLRAQVHRQGPIGQMARVAVQDPTWPPNCTRAQLSAYFTSMGARRFMMQTVAAAWDEFETLERKAHNRVKNKKARQARKANRPKKTKRR